MARLGCEHRRVAFVLQVLIYFQLNNGQGEAGDVQVALDTSPSHRRQISSPAPTICGHGVHISQDMQSALFMSLLHLMNPIKFCKQYFIY